MKFVFLLCLCILLFPATASSRTSCAIIKTNPDKWVAQRVDALVQTARKAYESDDALPAYHQVLSGITRTIDRCKLSNDPAFSVRYRQFLDYVATVSLDLDPHHQLGFNVTDEEYFDATASLVGIPDFLLQPDFVRWASRWSTLPRAKDYLRSLNATRGSREQLTFFSYSSRHLGTPDNDNSFRRLLIVVPGDASRAVPDKWVQFGVSDPGQRFRTRNVSVVSARMNRDGTFDAYFKDYFRIYHRDGSIEIKGRWELGEGDDNCANCHKSGVLPIFPVAGSVDPSEQEAVEIVNARFRSYGSPRFGGFLDQTKLGPGLSAARLEERAHRFGNSFAGTKLSDAMSCQSCHNPKRLGALNWPMDMMIVNSFVEGGQMPLGVTLTNEERSELYKKLIEEYFSTDEANPGILKSWLLGDSFGK